MKKIFLLLTLTVFSFFANAQIDLLDENGSVITDGQVFTFNTINENPAKLYYQIRNNTSQDISVRAEITEITGTNGTDVQFCMDVCLFGVSVGTVVPETTDPGFTVPANSTESGNGGIYFWNLDDTNSPITYKFKVYQVDSSNNQVGTAVNVTYVYDTTASTKTTDLANIGVNVLNTITKDNISLKLNDKTFIKVYDITGKVVKTEVLSAGNRQVNVSNYNSGVYLLEFSNDNGRKATIKIVKQ